MTDIDQYIAAIETGTEQAYTRLEQLGVEVDHTPWSGSGDPVASAEAVEALQREGAAATLDAMDRLRGTSVDVDTVVDVARSPEASPWDKGPTRDRVYSDLATAAIRVGITNGVARDQANAQHEGDPSWRAVDATASWLSRKADMERLETVTGRGSSAEAGRTEAQASRRPSYPQSPARTLSRAASAATSPTSVQSPSSAHSGSSSVSQAAPDLRR